MDASHPFAIVIPCRYGSSRYPGKPLAPLKGAKGVAKPLVERSWIAAAGVPDPAGLWVATDDRRIADTVGLFGGQVLMTSSSCRNGTERCAEAAEHIPPEIDIIVNFQGDALLTPPDVVPLLVDALLADPGMAVATPAMACSPETYAHLLRDELDGRVGGTTVVRDRQGAALYFSKRILPYLPPRTSSPHDHVLLHLGVYAYRRAALMAYRAAPPSDLELLEGLEQLRFLDIGLGIAAVRYQGPGWPCIELNNPSDVDPIEHVLALRGIE